MMKDDLNPRSPPRRSGNPTRATCCTASPSSGSRRSSSRSPTTRCSCSTRTATSRPGTRGRAHQGLSRRGDRRPPLSRFYPPDAIAAGRPSLAAEAAANGHFEDEGWRVRKDGSQFWANVTITPVHDHSNQLCGFIKITRDMTERKRLEELEASTHRLSVFIAMLAHELRNHLAPLRHSVGVLQSLPTRPRARAVPRRRASSGHATDAARRRPARRRAHHRRQARAERPADYRARHRVPRRRKHPAEAGRARAAHPRRSAGRCRAAARRRCAARPVLHNLLDNASKFSPLGGRIDVGATIEGPVVAIRVTDRGVGIARDALETIFDLFEQEGGAGRRPTDGFGRSRHLPDVRRTARRAHLGRKCRTRSRCDVYGAAADRPHSARDPRRRARAGQVRADGHDAAPYRHRRRQSRFGRHARRAAAGEGTRRASPTTRTTPWRSPATTPRS